jgi:hypothetical protein
MLRVETGTVGYGAASFTSWSTVPQNTTYDGTLSRYIVMFQAVLPTSGKGFLPDQSKNSAADEKIRPHPIFSKIG